MRQFFIKIMFICLLISGLASCNTTEQGTFSKTQEKTETYRLSAFSMPLQTEYIYDYLGMKFQLGEEVNRAIEEGKLFMYLDAGYEQSTQELAYARQAILYVPKEDREKDWENDTEKVKQWREQAQKLGYIGAYKRDILEETDITILTGCTENKNIGETPDGTWQYYISSNNISEVQPAVERFRKTLVTIYEMTPFVEGVSTKEIFSSYDLTLVNIFTTWASPCLQEIKELEQVYQQQATSEHPINIIGIVYDASQNDNREVIELAKMIQTEFNITYDFILPDNILMEGRLKGVTAFPETFFVDREGNMVGNYYLGARPKEDWLEVIEQELEALKGENNSAEKTNTEIETEPISDTESSTD